MSRIRPLLAVPLVAGFVLAACGSSPNVPLSSATGNSGPSGAPVGAVVTIANVSFAPAKVTISPGQSVEWVWDNDAIPHNVTSTSFQPARSSAAGSNQSTIIVRVPGFHSATQTTGTYFHTFTVPGVYNYRCTVHATMFGQVIVRP